MNQNMHIHSKYSYDSKMEIDSIAKILAEKGIKYAAITDHVEFNREPLSYVLMKLKFRNLEIDHINYLYRGKIKLLKAVEISEPHLYKSKVEELKDLDLDFIMGSIHNTEKSFNTKSEKVHSYYLYYRELLKMIEANQIDVIGHLDYINRYYNQDYSLPNQVNEVIKAIKEHNQIIEINTSAKRRCNFNTFPNLEKLAHYKLNQSEITIGTDAHQYDELVDNLTYVDNITEELDLKPVVFQKRKRINL